MSDKHSIWFNLNLEDSVLLINYVKVNNIRNTTGNLLSVHAACHSIVKNFIESLSASVVRLKYV